MAGQHSAIDHTGVTGVPSATAPNPTTIELGHASDTTLSRASAGVVAVEGTNLVKAGAITTSGLTQATARLLGRSTASTGAVEEITLGTNLSFAGTTLNAAGGGGSLSYVQNQLGADVSIVSANTFYDGPACTLSAGTWLLTGQILGLTGGNGGVYELKLWDGTTVLANTKVSLTAVAQWVGPLPLVGVVVIAAGTPTWKISATSNTTGYSIKAAGDGNISGNVASTLAAIKIA